MYSVFVTPAHTSKSHPTRSISLFSFLFAPLQANQTLLSAVFSIKTSDQRRSQRSYPTPLIVSLDHSAYSISSDWEVELASADSDSASRCCCCFFSSSTLPQKCFMMIDRDGTYHLAGQPRPRNGSLAPAIKQMVFAIVIANQRVKVLFANGTRFGMHQLKARMRECPEGRVLKKPEHFELTYPAEAPELANVRIELSVTYSEMVQCSDSISRAWPWAEVWSLAASVAEVEIPGVLVRPVSADSRFDLSVRASFEQRPLFEYDGSNVSMRELHSTTCDGDDEGEPGEPSWFFSPVDKRTMMDMVMARRRGSADWSVFTDIISDKR
jgi:hypothetical protein